VLEGLLQVLVANDVLVLKLAEVSQSLYPEVSVLLSAIFTLIILVLLAGDARVFAPFVHLCCFVVVNVEIKQFLPQIQTFATIFDTFVVLVDLK